MPDDSTPPKKTGPATIRVPGLRPPQDQPPSKREAALPVPFPKQGDGSGFQEAPQAEPESEAAEVAFKPLPEHPLRRFSLFGMADEIEANAAEAKPLLGKLAWQGQTTMIYAEPNTGKTLVMVKLVLDAINGGRIDPGNVYYVNADDGSSGLANKLRLLQDAGAHVIAPGHNRFETHQLAEMLTQAANDGSARGALVVLDTLKKFTDPMNKGETRHFGQKCGRYSMAGGTIVALGHTTKSPNADGSPRYQGTTDILEDFDTVYVAEPLRSKRDPNQRLVKFTMKKRRGDNPEAVAYAYAADSKIPYAEMLASVQAVDPDDLEDYAPTSEDVSDPQVMDAIVRLIEAGWDRGQMDLARTVSKECGISQRAAIQVLHRYTGNTPNEHLWNVDNGPHGKRIYRLIDQTRREP